jgi:CTP synthase (UTP-ammonia lyase)
MNAPLRVAIVGDHDARILAHQANPRALELAARSLDLTVQSEWFATDGLTTTAPLGHCDALWCVPGSPYRDMDGALRAIRYARERGIAFLGTCGGFQHVIVEYARDVLGWSDAEHAESAPHATRPVIVPLSCALVGVRGRVHLAPGSRLARAYGTLTAEEGYHCSYGLSAAMREALATGPLRVTAVDDAGDVRGVELDGPAFFVATLFQPERAALRDELPPLVAALLQAGSAGRES